MSLGHSPGISTNGLIFYYDMNNRKSFTGPTITNLAQAINTAGIGSSTGYSATEGTEVVNIPQIGPMTVKYVNIQNNYSQSGNCCPSLFQYGGWNVSPSTLYTYGIVYKCDSGYTGANYMYRYEYNGGTYVTELGVHTTDKRIYLGDGWWWAWNTTYTNASTNRINSSGLWYYQYSSFSDKLSVAKVLFAQGDWSGLHPKYWPDVNTSRSTTQALVDLTGNNTITANSLTYNSDGTFSFDSSKLITVPMSNLRPTTGITQECWFMTTNNTTQVFIGSQYGSSSNNSYALWINSTNQFAGGVNTNGTFDVLTYNTTISTNTYYHLVHTYNGSTQIMYINGVAVTNKNTSGNIIYDTNNTLLAIGNDWNGSGYNTNAAIGVIGKMPICKIYNRALSDLEVKQNFNAIRSRYGL